MRNAAPAGTFGVTIQGITAVIGGAPIVLAGAAFTAAGPAALLALLANFALAAAGALALAHLAGRFPRSGGVFMFAQRVLGAESGFAIGWATLLGSLAASAVFALGFATFSTSLAFMVASALLPDPPTALIATGTRLAVALATTAALGVRIARRLRRPATALTASKVLGMAGIGAVGLWALAGDPAALRAFLAEPPFPGGALGVVQAMGIMFMGVQGVTTLFGNPSEVRDPARTLPRASLATLSVATALYAALFLATATVGHPIGIDLLTFARSAGPEMVALGAQRTMGAIGVVWVSVTAVIAMITALEAQLQSAARLVRSMAQGGTLPRVLARGSRWDAPGFAALAAAAFAAVAIVALPDVRTAGVAAGIVFMSVMTLAHALAGLVRWRETTSARFASAAPWLAGAFVTAAVAATNVVIVPAAGLVVLAWLLLGAVLYIAALRQSAAAHDAALEAAEPDLVALRGRRPLVLTPIANPGSAEALVSVAHALAPPRIGRVTVLHVIAAERLEGGMANAQAVLSGSLAAAHALGLTAQALTSVADDPWGDIEAVARQLDPEIVLLGLADLGDEATLARLDHALGQVRSDVVVLRAPVGWHLERCTRVVVPLAGRPDQERLRARVLASLARLAHPEVELLRLLPPEVSAASRSRIERRLARLAEGRGLGRVACLALSTPDAVATLAERARGADLLILGLPRRSEDERALGAFVARAIAATPASCAVMLIHVRS